MHETICAFDGSGQVGWFIGRDPRPPFPPGLVPGYNGGVSETTFSGDSIVPSRYVLAVTTACVITGVGLGLSWYLQRSFLDRLRQRLHEAVAAGELPKEFDGKDVDEIMREGLDLKLPDSEMLQLQIAQMLSQLWFIWIPTVLGISIALAYLAGDRPPAGNTQ